MKSYLSILAVSLALTGCTWVHLTSSGDKARVLSLQEVSSCTKVGDTTASVLPRVAGVDRNKYKVEEELSVVARNAAAELGGDTVVANGGVTDGKQNFEVYRCINP